MKIPRWALVGGDFVSNPRKATVLLLALAVPALHAAKAGWKTVSADELAEAKPRLEAEAAAEVLAWTIDVDDRSFPQERTVVEYIRYKIFDPQRVEHLTRISNISFSLSPHRTDILARLTLPDGRTQEFGKDAIQERSLAKQAREKGFLGWLAGSSAEVTEKFMAITGVEAGAVLEYRVTRVERPPAGVQAISVQREGAPVREVAVTVRTNEQPSFSHQVFVFNKQSARMEQDAKARTVRVTATHLPSTLIEPVMGPATDYALTILSCYTSRDVMLVPRSGNVKVPGTVEAKLGPWAFYSTLTNWFERDRGWATKRVKQLALEVTAGAADETEKARRIHGHVQQMAERWRKRSPPKTPISMHAPNSLDDVLDWEKSPDVFLMPEEFHWLAVSLCQSAGLDAHTVSLPNRQLSRFYRENASPVFLPFPALAVKLGGTWTFSSPHHPAMLPFGMVPWEQEGQLGLIARDRQEDFVPVPPAPANKTIVTSGGTFAIDDEGTLSGECVRTFSGHRAVQVRAELAAARDEKRTELAKAKLGLDPKVVEMIGLKITALDDPAKDLGISAQLRWPGFAVRTKDRLVVRAAVLRAEAVSPFAATERRSPVHFPFFWQEFDRVVLSVPAGFEPESPAAPQPMPGESLSYGTRMSYEKETRRLFVLREFSSSLRDVAPKAYPLLRDWYAALARADQHEIVFRRADGTPAAKSD